MYCIEKKVFRRLLLAMPRLALEMRKRRSEYDIDFSRNRTVFIDRHEQRKRNSNSQASILDTNRDRWRPSL